MLATLPTPPPYSGPETAAALLLETGLGTRIELFHVRTNVHDRNADKGSITLSSPARLARALLQTATMIVRRRPRLLFIYLSQNTTGFLRDALLIGMARASGMGVVAQVHGANFANFHRSASAPLRRLIQLTLRGIDDVVVLADRFRSHFDGLVARERIWVIPNAVAPASAPSRRLHDKECTFLFMGHLSAAKGFFDLLRAAAIVLERLPQARFEFAGEWLLDERNIHLDECARRVSVGNGPSAFAELTAKYADRVQHLGVVSGRTKAEALERADVFVFPSYSEGFPMAVLDAMAAGLPLIVTPVGALPEILTVEQAVFVDPGDVDQLAAAMIRMAEDPVRRAEMGSANRALVEQRFTPRRVADSLAQCLCASAERRAQA